jgi:hypothetical protein
MFLNTFVGFKQYLYYDYYKCEILLHFHAKTIKPINMKIGTSRLKNKLEEHNINVETLGVV